MTTKDPAVESVDEPVVEPGETPLLRILTPDATDEEVAALVAVVSAMAATGAEEPTARPTPAWSARASGLP